MDLADVRTDLSNLLVEAQAAAQLPGAHPLLPAVVDWMAAMQRLFARGDPAPIVLRKESSGIYRFISNDPAFAASPMGRKVLALAAAMRAVAKAGLGQ
jgi:hypothetical protein